MLLVQPIVWSLIASLLMLIPIARALPRFMLIIRIRRNVPNLKGLIAVKEQLLAIIRRNALAFDAVDFGCVFAGGLMNMMSILIQLQN